MTEISVLLWGVDGDLNGSENRLMAHQPILSFGDRLARVLSLDWQVDPESGLAWIADEGLARAAATRLSAARDLEIKPGWVVAVCGPELQADLRSIGFSDSVEWIEVQQGFFVTTLSVPEYRALNDRLVRHATEVFDKRVADVRGARIDPISHAALRTLRGLPGCPAEVLQVRNIFAADVEGDDGSYRNAVVLGALKLGVPEDKLLGWVSHYASVRTRPKFSVGSGPVLRSFGIDPDIREAADTPTELRRALERFDQYCAAYSDTRVLSISAAPEYRVLLSPYPSRGVGKGLMAEQKIMAEFLKTLPLGAQEQIEEESFEAVTDPTVAETSLVYYVFPFFLTPRRRNTWGVIPFARHHSIGLLIHEDHPLAVKWGKRSQPRIDAPGLLTFPPSPRLPLSPVRRADELTVTWEDVQTDFAGAVSATANNRGRVYYRRGYIVDQLMVGLKADIMAGLMQPGGTSDEKRFFPDAPGKEAATKWDLYLFDWAEHSRMERLVSPEFRVVRLPHDIDVPVGVGFSLACLPALLQHRLWWQISEQAFDVFASVEEPLRSMGIEMLRWARPHAPSRIDREDAS